VIMISCIFVATREFGFGCALVAGLFAGNGAGHHFSTMSLFRARIVEIMTTILTSPWDFLATMLRHFSDEQVTWRARTQKR